MTKTIGRLKKSELLAKGAWRSLMLDKKLATIPLITLLISLLGLIVIGLVGFANPSGSIYQYNGAIRSIENINFSLSFKPLAYVLVVIAGIYTSMVWAVGVGAVTHGAIQRFKGEKPTVKESLVAAKKRWRPLASFVLFSFTIGLVINEIASRLPYGNLAVAWLANASWGIASFFAIPLIIEDDESLGPLSATKKSLSIMKQVWGESLILTVGIGAFQFFIVALYTVIVMVGAIFLVLLGNFVGSIIVPGIILASIALIGLLAMAMLFNTLEIFIKAALYHYATTGESPVTFDKNILRQAFTPKKAKKVFSI